MNNDSFKRDRYKKIKRSNSVVSEEHVSSGLNDSKVIPPKQRFTIDDALINSVAEQHKCSCNATALLVDDDEFNLIPLNMLLQNRKINAV